MPSKSAFLDALGFEQTPARDAYLDQACQHDAKLRRHIESLLEIHESINDSGLYMPSDPSGDWELGDRREKFDACSLGVLIPSDHKAALGRIDCYEALRVIGLGGSSVVLEAFDTRLERIVAIKVLAKRDGLDFKARNRFRRGALAAARVTHPHVVSVLAVGEQNGAPYVVSEFVRGQTLARLLQRDGPLPVPDILRLTHQVLLGLAEIHEKGLVHRDLKPDNIILKHPDGLVKIADFGIAKGAEESGVTQTGEVHGTPQYMSPEQAEGKSVDERSDLFSLGAVVYAMAAGHSPFNASTPLAAMRRVCDDKPRPVRELNPDVPDWLAESILWLLNKNPQRRPQQIREFLDRFEEHTGTGWAAARVRRRRGRKTWLCLAALMLFVVSELFVTDLLQRSFGAAEELIGRRMLGRGVIAVQVDDPTVHFVLRQEDVPLSRDGLPPQIRRNGSFRGVLTPGVYAIRGTKDGELVVSERVVLAQREVLEFEFTVKKTK